MVNYKIMTKRNPFKLFLSLSLSLFFLAACAPGAKEAKTVSNDYPRIFPDYTFVTVPCNIAPLNFSLPEARQMEAVVSADGKELARKQGRSCVQFPEKSWKEWLSACRGKMLDVTVSVWTDAHPEGIRYKPFPIYVSGDPIDPWIAYRLIEPGYELWNRMGIYQRDLTSFEEKAIVTNRQNHDGCVNCHSFCDYSPESFMFHARGVNGTTVLVRGGKPTRLDLSKMEPHKSGTYPMWHPSGRYILFSSNDTHQAFYHFGHMPVEVYDLASDLMIYDVANNRVLTDPRFTNKENMETFPAFSPDGKQVYFCTASTKKMPMEYKSLKYALCRVGFDEKTGQLLEQVDTLYSPAVKGGSVSFPRLSPDGKYLLYTEAACATFPIWHKEADLKMIRLADNKEMDTAPLNSDDTESYHAWSSDGRWVIFSSRRLNGRYTRLFIAAMDTEGRFGKPFLLPQKDPAENVLRMKSYNIPEFIRGEVKLDKREVTSLFGIK
ncbi:MAG: hypothetical protein LUH63_22740 [Parabacteroides sp.]|nr:hypothetical protein [Parabacteroides sp.]